ncbi:hypothetical protein HU200_002237 [Digitaria exilis]|uniref:WRC domain-containing protein n=1 Tax=Digitaria exilis TaxID=1010633 RepID=A0A835KVG3_9POAL|nr:hypothetical protein HU200_002237 [Digitaria exilis]CAB3447974.1 unnamed protein product [Digitaria exilis]
MRIRRRPPGQPLAYLLPSDPPASRPPPGDRQERPAGDDGREELQLHPDAAADLGDERRSSPVRPPALLPLLPQDSVVERGRSLGAQQHVPAPDGHRRLENGHHHVPELEIKAGEHFSLSNGGGAAGEAVVVAATMGANATKQQEMKGDSGGGGKKPPRGLPGMLKEGSRCSRKNGRGWRCSQPTMWGYALCQYHLGKGRLRAAATAAALRVGAGQLGRTENGKKASAVVAVAPTAPLPPLPEVPPPPPPPKAEVAPPSVQNC